MEKKKMLQYSVKKLTMSDEFNAEHKKSTVPCNNESKRDFFFPNHHSYNVKIQK